MLRATTARTALLAVAVLLAGCAGGATPGATPAGTDTDGDPGPTATPADAVGEGDSLVAFWVSDQPGAIDDFRHLNVTVTRVSFERAGEGGWVVRDVPDRTVDLTRLQGTNATRIANISVPNGTYGKVRISVGGVNGTLTDGSSARVKLPSGRLKITEEFTVGPNASVNFVYDVSVVKAGKSGKYVLKPVVGESGTDVPIDDVGREGEGDGGPPDDAGPGNGEGEGDGNGNGNGNGEGEGGPPDDAGPGNGEGEGEGNGNALRAPDVVR